MLLILGLLAKVVAAPVTLPTKGLMFVLDKIRDQAEHEMLDEGKIHQQLMELQMLLDQGKITEEEFYETEEALLERMDAIMAYKLGLSEDDEDENEEEE